MDGGSAVAGNRRQQVLAPYRCHSPMQKSSSPAILDAHTDPDHPPRKDAKSDARKRQKCNGHGWHRSCLIVNTLVVATLTARGSIMEKPLKQKTIAFLATDGVEQVELTQ